MPTEEDQVCSRCTRFPKGCKYEPKFVLLDQPTGSRRASSSGIRKPALKTHQSPQVEDIHRLSSTEKRSSAEISSSVEPRAMLPSPHLANSYTASLMHQLIADITTTIFPLASRSFVRRLTSSAMETPPLLNALLATYESQQARRTLTLSAHTDNTVLKLTTNAIAGLRAALASDGASRAFEVETLMTAMALCTNAVCNGKFELFRMHLTAIRQILLSADSLLFKQVRGSDRDSLEIYLVKWFAALEVSAGLSLFQCNEWNKICDVDGLARAWTCQKIFNYSDDVVDDICGFSLNLVPYFQEIGRLVRLRYKTASSCHNTEDDDEITAQAEILENKIAAIPSPRIPTNFLASHQRELFEELRNTHPAFVHTALLHLHSRVQLLPKDHPKVRLDVTNILQVVKNVRASSLANILLIWPIFSAGCETESPIERAIVDERMSIMQALGMGNYTHGRQALGRIWSSGTTLRWDVYHSQSGVDLVLF